MFYRGEDSAKVKALPQQGLTSVLLFKVIFFSFFFVMRYITAFGVLLFVFAAVQVIPYFGPGTMTDVLFVLHIVLTSGSFHNIWFM
jgi:hypothetical protein